MKEIQAVYAQLGYDVFPVSAKTGQGIEDLRRRIEGKITVFGGPSGVGKSTTLNAIQPGILRVTGEISEKIRRGNIRRDLRNWYLLMAAIWPIRPVSAMFCWRRCVRKNWQTAIRNSELLPRFAVFTPAAIPMSRIAV